MISPGHRVQDGANDLAETYALCSRDSPAIYTVDDEGSKAQCILVHDADIVFVGSLCTFDKDIHTAEHKNLLP